MTHSDLPASALNLPGTQGRHDADASSGWYFPDGQSKPIILLLFKLKETEIEKKKMYGDVFLFVKKKERDGEMLKNVITEMDQVNFIHLHSVNSVSVITPFTSI